MQWRDQAIILATWPHGEKAFIAELFARRHGRQRGFVRGGPSRRHDATRQTGSWLDATWQARLPEQLGTWTLELRRHFAGVLLDDRLRLAALVSSCTLLRTTCPEREPLPLLFDATLELLSALTDAHHQWPQTYVHWELTLLKELGFGLDLTGASSLDGSPERRLWIDRQTGRLVARQESRRVPPSQRMAMPSFLLTDDHHEATPRDILAGLALTEHFLVTRVLDSHDPLSVLPATRNLLCSRLVRHYQRQGYHLDGFLSDG